MITLLKIAESLAGKWASKTILVKKSARRKAIHLYLVIHSGALLTLFLILAFKQNRILSLPVYLLIGFQIFAFFIALIADKLSQSKTFKPDQSTIPSQRRTDQHEETGHQILALHDGIPNSDDALNELFERIDDSEAYSDRTILSAVDRGRFKVQFKQMHPDIYQSQQRLYPTLSNNDIWLLTYLHLKLSTKEIGALLGIEAASVRKSKMRLNKKIKILNAER